MKANGRRQPPLTEHPGQRLNRRRWRWWLVIFLPLLTALCGVSCRGRSQIDPSSVTRMTTVTFCEHVAPIVYDHCVVCHRPDGNAPFSLIRYEDVCNRAQLICELTQQGFMPPWLPAPGRGDFAGERRLTDEQIVTFQHWVDAGTPEGNPEDLPKVPVRTSGWQLGEPDVVLTMPEPFSLPPDGPDVYRNFVFRSPVTETRHVRAWEFDPGNRLAVHHAFVLKDRSGIWRRFDDADPGPGYDSMELPGHLEGHFNGWAPGKTPYAGMIDMAWRVDTKTDISIELHMQPQGKPEAVQSRLALYFADQPPTRFPAVLLLGSMKLDIPAEESQYLVTDELTLPADVDVLGIVPHAHYLARDMKATATLPDGSTKWLIHIPQWNFNWQANYRYRKPVFLPRGSKLSLAYTYDNSSKNPFNPRHPPQRVVYGPNTTDEMCELWIQVVPRNQKDLAVLQQVTRIKMQNNTFALQQSKLETDASDWRAHNSMGLFFLKQRRLAEAVTCFKQVLLLAPDAAGGYFNLAYTRAEQGQEEEAIEYYREAIRVNPTEAEAHLNLAFLYRDRKQMDLCVDHLTRAVKLQPRRADWQFELGHHLLEQGKLGPAIEMFRRCLQLRPNDIAARYRLGLAFYHQDRFDESEDYLQQVIELKPDHHLAHFQLGQIFQSTDNVDAALECYARVIHINPGFAPAHLRSGLLLQAAGELEAALKCFLTTMRLEPNWSVPAHGAAWIFATHPNSEIRRPQMAIAIAEELATRTNRRVAGVLDTLAAAHAAAGKYEKAVQIARSAHELATVKNNNEQAQRIQRRLDLYKHEKPFRDSAAPADKIGENGSNE